MYLKDFAESRGISSKTISAYINRNKNLLEKHKKVKNGKVWLDKKAVEILSEKYPLAVEKENQLAKELVEAQAKIISLQEILVNLQPKLLLADEQAETLREENKELSSKLKELEKALEKEQSKSWWDKLLKR